MTTPDDLDSIYQFWFGDSGGSDVTIADRQPMWFNQDDAFDATIRERFGDLIAPAAAADWDIDSLTRTQQVGLIVLLDQFPRNIYRTTGDAFVSDPRARQLANSLIAEGTDRFLRVERFFLLLPLMHSEDADDQDRCVLLYAQEVVNAPPATKAVFRGGLSFAIKHRDLILRFGRFPHRNAMIGRETTDEEAAFLAEHGRGF